MFPNVVLLLRDAAHALRIAVKDPLHRDVLLGDVWNSLFDKRHALVPDIMNSPRWHDLLQNIQRVVLRTPCEDRPLTVVLKHLRFAKQRFDSTADPVAKVCYMFLPITTLLAYRASDERMKPPERKLAKDLLKKFTSKFVVALGVSADWGLVTQAFLRLFDKNAHDIAKTQSEIQAFKDAMRILFAEGAVFSSRSTQAGATLCEVPAIGGYFGSKGVKPEFVTQQVEKTLGSKLVFSCGDEQVLLGGLPREEEVKEIVDRLKFITEHVIDRVDAELGHLERFCCFDIDRLRAASSCNDQGQAKQLLRRHLRDIAKDVGVDGSAAAREYRDITPLLLELTSPGRPLATASNSQMWAALLDDNIMPSHMPQAERPTVQALNVLIRFYISIEDGECVVERDLGTLTSITHAHKNGGGALADDAMMAKSDEDLSAADIWKVSEMDDTERLGPTGRRWAALWRALYGARLGGYNKKS